MPRIARKKSISGIHHIMVRGINQQAMFHYDVDREQFIDILRKTKNISEFQLYGYCLLDNQFHLLIKEGPEDLSKIMKRIGIAYVYWYNKKYERSGPLFQDRFKSQTIEDDEYLLRVLRYIQQKPLAEKFATDIKEYRWSSYAVYTGKMIADEDLVDRHIVLGMFEADAQAAINSYIAYMNQPEEEQYLEPRENKKYTDDEAKAALNKLLQEKSIHMLHQVEKSRRDEVLRKLRQIDGISIRQIERITGIGRNVVANA